MSARRIVEPFDVPNDVLPGSSPRGVGRARDQFSFERAKETFHGCIIVTVAGAAQAGHQAVRRK